MLSLNKMDLYQTETYVLSFGQYIRILNSKIKLMLISKGAFINTLVVGGGQTSFLPKKKGVKKAQTLKKVLTPQIRA